MMPRNVETESLKEVGNREEIQSCPELRNKLVRPWPRVEFPNVVGLHGLFHRIRQPPEPLRNSENQLIICMWGTKKC
jgi:hypothetical protein